jgi:hypothetical protein
VSFVTSILRVHLVWICPLLPAEELPTSNRFSRPCSESYKLLLNSLYAL